MAKLRVVKAEIRRCTPSDVGTMPGRGWILWVPLGVEAGDMEIDLRLSVGPTKESGEFLGFTLEEAKSVARALGCKPVVKRK